MQQLTIQDMFGSTREKWLMSARHTARKLLSRNETITIEDVLKVCPRPTYIHRNTTGRVFEDEDFQPVGFEKSKRPVSKGRWIRTWKLKEHA